MIFGKVKATPEQIEHWKIAKGADWKDENVTVNLQGMSRSASKSIVSDLADGSILCTWEYNTRTEKVIGIIPHYMAAHWTGKQCAQYFKDNGIENSANYCIGYDGDCWCNVEEQNRAWTSSSSWADQRCITVEIGGSANDVSVIPEPALEKFKQLATDIALRYGIKAYKYTGDTDGNFMLHRFFAATPCPGDWFVKQIPSLIKDINKRIKSGSVYRTGWEKIDGKWYFHKDGGYAKGWLKNDGKWYYFNKKGVMQTGWQKVNGYWYLLAGGDSGRMLTGWQNIGGNWYYLREGDSGRMVTGWQKINNKWYYFAKGGAMTTGWKKIKGIWYYFDRGVMQTGTILINGKEYKFDTNGHWIKR